MVFVSVGLKTDTVVSLKYITKRYGETMQLLFLKSLGKGVVDGLGATL